MKQEERKPFDKKDVVMRFAMSGVELAVYIVAPMIAAYYVGRNFGKWGSIIGLTFGAIAGLFLAVRRALKMTV